MKCNAESDSVYPSGAGWFLDKNGDWKPPQDPDVISTCTYCKGFDPNNWRDCAIEHNLGPDPQNPECNAAIQKHQRAKLEFATQSFFNAVLTDIIDRYGK
ncbi:hypothetical protein FWC31_03265 [Candidatus Saccharibacteria bacterium]|nr:hypothetical protein [Candidatus Saccharibacteria bacterium]